MKQINTIVLLSSILLGTEQTLLAADATEAEASTQLTRTISSSRDDMEEKSNGKVYYSSPDLELTKERGKYQEIGLRFQNITIPKDAQITKAYLQFTTHKASSKKTNLNIYAEKVAHSTIFTKRDKPHTRHKTIKHIIWNPAPWTNKNEHGLAQQTPSLNELVQEIINQKHWQSGNALSFFIKGEGYRVAKSYDNSKQLAPTLHIEYKSTHNKQTNNNVTTLKKIAITTPETTEKKIIKVAKPTPINVTAPKIIKTKKQTVKVAKPAPRKIIAPKVIKKETKVMNSIAKSVSVPKDYKTIKEALKNVSAGTTIILDPGTYNVSKINIDKKNITIASKYITTKNEKYIESTIIKGKRTQDIFTGLTNKSNNLKIIGLSFSNSHKAIIFYDYGVVQHCHFKNIHSDVVSFEGHAVGGEVTNCLVEGAGDEAVDIDSRKGGTFLIAHNKFLNSDDDGIEIRLYNYKGNSLMKYDIHHNLISSSGEDAIQLIDYDSNTKREFNIHHNIIRDSKDVGIGTTVKGNTKENKKGSYMIERVNVYNNYFYNNGYHITGGDNMVIVNNIFEKTKGIALYKADGKSIADYNIFYNNKKDNESSKLGNNNIYENPNLNENNTPRAGSVAIDAGVTNFKSQLKVSNYSGNKPDIGVHEFGQKISKKSINNTLLVDIGEDKTIIAPNNSIKLKSTTSDQTAEYKWSMLNGPAKVEFDDNTAEDTTLNVSKQGIYTIQLTLDNGSEKRSDSLKLYYLADKTNIHSLFNRPMLQIDGDKYSRLLGTAKKLKSEKSLLMLDNNTVADYDIDSNGKDIKFKMKLLVKSNNDDSKKVQIVFKGSAGEEKILFNVPASTEYQWVTSKKLFNTTAGIWSIKVISLDSDISIKTIQLNK